MHRRHISSGTPWEDKVGYSRAVRVGDMVFVAGTLAADEAGRIHAPDDGYEQARYIFSKIERALREAGASLSDVVRTRMFVSDLRHQEGIGRAHGEFFSSIRPASTMIGGAVFVSPRAVVEIEVDAVIAKIM